MENKKERFDIGKLRKIVYHIEDENELFHGDIVFCISVLLKICFDSGLGFVTYTDLSKVMFHARRYYDGPFIRKIVDSCVTAGFIAKSEIELAYGLSVEIVFRPVFANNTDGVVDCVQARESYHDIDISCLSPITP